MLCVKTKIGKSKISGLGLFADQFIPKGAVVWQFEPTIDILFSKEKISSLAKPSFDQFNNYSFFDKTHGMYMLCGDDGRFFNHSRNCNCDDSHPDKTFAKKDISPGEELTVDYTSFYGNLNEHPEILYWN